MDKPSNININVDSKKTKFIVHIVMFILGFILGMNACESNPTVIEDCGEVKAITYDTVTTRHIDTIQFIDTIKYHVAIEIPTPIYDTITELNTYTAQVEDSLIKGSIVSKVDGVLVDQSFEYTPKFPKYIKIHDTTTVTKTVIKEIPKKRELYMGLYAGGNNTTFNLTPVISFKDKKDRMFSYGYNVIDNTHNVGFQTKIKLK